LRLKKYKYTWLTGVNTHSLILTGIWVMVCAEPFGGSRDVAGNCNIIDEAGSRDVHLEDHEARDS
jgi:hypothetical protein